MNTYTIVCRKGVVALDYDSALLPGDDSLRKLVMSRAQGQLDLLKPIQKFLPDFRATFSSEETPSQFIGDNLRRAALGAASSAKGRESMISNLM